MLNDPDLLSLFIGFEPADSTLPTPDLRALACDCGLGPAALLGVIANAERVTPTRPALT